MNLRALFGLGPEKSAKRPLVLTTERLHLRPPRNEDYRAWSGLREESRDFLQPWEPRWPRDHLSRSAFRRRVRWATTEAHAERAFALLLFRQDDGVLVGGITISNIRRAPSRSASLGYWVGEAYARQGLMRDAVERVADFSFKALGLVRLEAACLENNVASRALLKRCGFQEEGIVRGYLEVNGTVRDHCLYARLAQDRPSEANRNTDGL